MTSANSSYVGWPATIMEWDSWSGKSYTCLNCYQRSLTATATTVTIRNVEPKDVPLGACCAMCEKPLGGIKHVG